MVGRMTVNKAIASLLKAVKNLEQVETTLAAEMTGVKENISRLEAENDARAIERGRAGKILKKLNEIVGE